MPKTSYLAAGVLTHLLRDGSFTKLTNLYVSLHTASPTAAGSHADELTIGVGGYSRAVIPVDDDEWSTPSTVGDYQVSVNEDTISFGTASDDLGEVTHYGVNDAASAGNMLWYGALETPRTINNGDPIQIPPGAFQMREG